LAVFLTTNGICDRLDHIITEAKEELVLVSPYLKLSTNVVERLKDADKRGVKISLIYGKRDELDREEWEKLDAIENLSLHFYQNLHAKCYHNEKELIITSMNLHEFSEKRNREMGVLVRKGDADRIYDKAAAEVRSILHSSEDVETGGGARLEGSMGDVDAPDDSEGEGTEVGYCIRCRREICFDLEAPYCRECYWTWSRLGGNVDYREQWCHDCGEDWGTTFRKSRCGECYDKSNSMW
jgi:HKD family nuclease